MHMHLHLKDSLLDYGPVYSLWCFAFEKFNGALGSYHTNSRQIEPQIMQAFLIEKAIRNIHLPKEYEVYLQLLPSTQKGSLSYATCSDKGVPKLMELASSCSPSSLDFRRKS